MRCINITKAIKRHAGMESLGILQLFWALYFWPAMHMFGALALYFHLYIIVIVFGDGMRGLVVAYDAALHHRPFLFLFFLQDGKGVVGVVPLFRNITKHESSKLPPCFFLLFPESVLPCFCLVPCLSCPCLSLVP